MFNQKLKRLCNDLQRFLTRKLKKVTEVLNRLCNKDSLRKSKKVTKKLGYKDFNEKVEKSQLKLFFCIFYLPDPSTMQNMSFKGSQEGYAGRNNKHNIHLVFWCLPGA